MYYLQESIRLFTVQWNLIIFRSCAMIYFQLKLIVLFIELHCVMFIEHHVTIPPKPLEVCTYSYNTSCESPNQWLIGLKRIKVWQHFYLVPHPLEKSHLTPYMRSENKIEKVVIIKNLFFHGLQPCKGIFEICSHRCCIFTIFRQSF